MDIAWKCPLIKTNLIGYRNSYVSKMPNGNFMSYSLMILGFMECTLFFQRMKMQILRCDMSANCLGQVLIAQ